MLVIKIYVSLENKFFKYLDENKQVIVGKSDIHNDDFDILLNANENIEEFIIPNSIKKIYCFAFCCNEKLKKIDFSADSKLETIGKFAFASTSITNVVIPKSVTKIDKYAFSGCQLKTVIFEKGSKIQIINDNSFCSNINLNRVEISGCSELLVIGKEAFAWSKINNFYIPSNVEKIEDDCFRESKLTNFIISPLNHHFKYIDQENQIIVSKSDKNIDEFDTIFWVNKDIKEITIPKNIKHINSYAFYNCKNLFNIIIPKDSELRTIGNEVFCRTNINVIFIPSKVEKIGDKCFSSTPLNRMYISPDNKYFKYTEENHQIIVSKSDNKSDVFDTLFFASRDIKYAFIPSYIKYIKSCAFQNAYYLKTVEIPEDSQLISIGHDAFSYSSIREFKIKKAIEKVDRSAFFGCENLKVFEIEEGSKLKTLETSLLAYCSSLKTIIIPDDCDIECTEHMLWGSSVESFYIPSKMILIYEKFCLDTDKLTKITISPNNQHFKYS